MKSSKNSASNAKPPFGTQGQRLAGGGGGGKGGGGNYGSHGK